MKISKEGLKKVSGPMLNRIGCGVIGGFVVAYVLNNAQFFDFLWAIFWGCCLVVVGSILEHGKY